MFVSRPKRQNNRLNAAEIVCARDRRLKEVRMRAVLQEAFTCLCFLTFLFLITYSNRTSHSFRQVQHLRTYFLNSRQNYLDYNKVCSLSFSFHLGYCSFYDRFQQSMDIGNG